MNDFLGTQVRELHEFLTYTVLGEEKMKVESEKTLYDPIFKSEGKCGLKWL